jgi:hypothetical protein
MATSYHTAGLFLIGMALGSFLSIPAPLNFVSPYIGMIFIVLGIILLVKG